MMTAEHWTILAGVAVASLALGWLLRGWVPDRRPGEATKRRPSGTDAPQSRVQELREQVARVEADLSEKQSAFSRHEADLARVDAELSRRERDLETLRSRLEKREREYDALVRELGERRARMTEVGADLYRLNQELIRREERLATSMESVTERGRELELLKQIDAGYQTELDELTQDVQLQYGEIARLKSVLDARHAELAEAQALLAQRETELERIIQSREAAERDIQLGREHLLLVTDEHDRLLDQLREAAEHTEMRARLMRALREESHLAFEPPGLPSSIDDVQSEDGPPDRPALGVPEDDLTRIRGIGEGYAGMLKAAGVQTFEQLSAMMPDDLREILSAPHWREPNVETWIAEARALAANDRLPQPPEPDGGTGGWIDELIDDDEEEEPPDDLIAALE